MKIERRKVRADVPSVSMGDIAFNLLIFFFILARANDDSFIHWTPAKGKDLHAPGESKVAVLVDPENKIYFNGKQVGLRDLTPRIKEALGDLPAGQRRVLLKVDREATAAHFEPVIEAISEAGGDLVHILEKLKE